jgi:hypothetical protein
MKTHELATTWGLSVRQTRRRIDSKAHILFTNYGEFSYNKNDELPPEVIKHLLQLWEPPADEKQVHKKPKVVNGHNKKLTLPKSKGKGKALSIDWDILFAVVIVLADGLSCAHLAANNFPEMKLMAIMFWFSAGLGIGYSAVRMTITYQGHDSDSWLWGFGLFQVALHFSAFSIFDNFLGEGSSFYIGKLVMGIGLGLAMIGLGLILKQKYKNKK